MFIVIEGIDGTGKSTLAENLATILRDDLNLATVTTAEPTHVDAGLALRKAMMRGQTLHPMDEINLFHLDRAHHVEQFIRPVLDQGRIVICDRYYYSTMAYQGARGADPRIILQLNRKLALTPDLVILLDLDPEKALRRIAKRNEGISAMEDLANLRRCREIFQSLTPESIGTHLITLDARMDPRTLATRAFDHLAGTFNLTLFRPHFKPATNS